MIKKRYNFVTFKPTDWAERPPQSAGSGIFLELPAPWIIRGGVAPDVNAAEVSFSEWEKIHREGTLLKTGWIFFYSTDPEIPDRIIKDVAIVDVEPVTAGGVRESLETGVLPSLKVARYRLWFADFRRRFQYPRGGRLSHGLVNANPQKTGETESPRMKNGELLYECFKASGGLFSVQSSVLDDFPAISNLQWFGAHPASEMKKILEHCDHVIVPGNDGYGKVWLLADGDEPAIPPDDELTPLRIDGLQRAGKTVIITSAPSPIIDRYDGDYPSADWSFVSQDPNGEWVDEFDNPIYGQVGPLIAYITEFNSMRAQKPEFIRRAYNQLFRCIRIDTSKFPPHLSPILRKMIGKEDGASPSEGFIFRASDVRIRATIARQDPADGKWRNTAGPVDVAISWMGDGNVLVAEERLTKLDDTASSDGEDKPFERGIPSTDIKIYFAVEAAADSKKEYFCVGFRQGLEEIEQLDDAAAKVAFETGGDEDTIVIAMPELRYIRPNGNDDGLLKTDLVARAKRRATEILKHSGRPLKTRTAVGFLPQELNGVVSEIQIDQQACTTAFMINSWFSPAEALRRDELERIRSSAFPEQQQSHESRLYTGGSGESQPAVPMMPPPISTAISTEASDDSDTPIWVLCKNASAASSGTNTTAGTINYDIYSWTIDGSTPVANRIATNVPLQPVRWVMRTLAAPDGSPGLAYLNAAGSWQLVAVFGETRGYVGCDLP